ncbi:MAG: hemolysin III family protein [Cellulomonas sp.]|uniref:DNA-binding protein n=1 Tax=Cellulomonas gelida TaxID=1712 RepID=A0A4Y3KN20_9CELL|nr:MULTISPECIES: hemolysin III family protein [Cellulomonas]KMM45830.1 hemolysin III [Cellulomonas sp. A375-1]MCR6649914.1 hemolysin III family protein [Cellulomonas sp.]MCR6705806.1 hemolysin III family protein [Cellulomonas sp.]GEA85442.1 DNA-binding protein [Cellulomonas gelida]GGL14785.1 DNA-binding protein [Cellulomonas gelida]
MASTPATGGHGPQHGALPSSQDTTPLREEIAISVTRAVEQVAATVKPMLRGWIHAGVSPFILAAAIVLVALSPTPAARWSNAVFGLSAVLLFGTSAIYHRGTWSPRVAGVLRRLDHTNIFLIIAGTYTPLAVLLLPATTARNLLIVVWSGALVGLLARIFWLGAPRWVYVPVYLALGWVAVAFLPQFYRSGGAAIVWLIAAGGLAYTVGAVVYGLKKPNPSPRYFGFHEIFHALTVVAITCHYIAVSIATYALR